MTTTNPEELKKLQQRYQKAFDRSNPKFLQNIQGDEKKLKAVREIGERSQVIQKHLAEHCRKHRSQWVARETVKVFEENQNPVMNHPKPNWVLEEAVNVSYIEEARKRVNQRIQTRIIGVGNIGRNMQSNMTKNTPDPKLLQKYGVATRENQAVAIKPDFDQSM
jgi:HD-GYP domain-containing protein (c-di-GMP phosphodiesterase class II)